MKKNGTKVLIIFLVIFIILAGVVLGYKILKSKENQETAVEETEDVYICPIDFDKLQKENEHIYAWIDIPEAETSYPILQHTEDDSFYLDHGLDKKYRQAGSIFTEKKYNSKDFNDPVTIIYGHRMKSGDMFGNIQGFYSNPENFEKHNMITVYTPEKEFKYKVFAATKYDDRHILGNYNFNNGRMFQVFFKSILSIRDLSANIDKNVELEIGDKVLILSTCLKGDFSQRYLVFAKLMV